MQALPLYEMEGVLGNGLMVTDRVSNSEHPFLDTVKVKLRGLFTSEGTVKR